MYTLRNFIYHSCLRRDNNIEASFMNSARWDSLKYIPSQARPRINMFILFTCSLCMRGRRAQKIDTNPNSCHFSSTAPSYWTPRRFPTIVLLCFICAKKLSHKLLPLRGHYFSYARQCLANYHIKGMSDDGTRSNYKINNEIYPAEKKLAGFADGTFRAPPTLSSAAIISHYR